MKLQRWSRHFWTFWKHLIPSSQYVGPNVRSSFQILMGCGKLCEVWKCNSYHWIWFEGGCSHFDDNFWSIKPFFQTYAMPFYALNVHDYIKVEVVLAKENNELIEEAKYFENLKVVDDYISRLQQIFHFSFQLSLLWIYFNLFFHVDVVRLVDYHFFMELTNIRNC